MPFKNYHAARQREPDRKKQYRTIQLADGITAILMGEGSEWVVQTVRADREKYNVEQFKRWLIEHNMKNLVEPAE